MKTNLVKIAKALVLASMTMLLANCSKDNGGSANTGYVWGANGTCVSSTTGQTTTNTTLCMNSNGTCNGTYYYGNNYGQVMTIQCSSTSTVYYNSSYQSGYSQVYNCRGLSLYQLINNGYNNTGYNNTGYNTGYNTGSGTYQPVVCQ